MINEQTALWCLEELANRDEQERLWLGRTKGEMSSLEEAWCGLFDDAGISRALESGYMRKKFSVEFCQKLELLRDVLRQLPEMSPPQIVIEHPKMEEVRRLAADLINMFIKESGSVNKNVQQHTPGVVGGVAEST